MKYILALTFIALGNISRAGDLVDIDEIATGLNSIDADTFTYYLFTDDSKFNYVREKIESGDIGWIDIGRRLEKYSDGGVGTDLAISFAKAIQINPSYSLSLMTDYEVWWSCSVPLLEPTKSEFDAFVERTIVAVEKLNDNEVSKKKKSCLDALFNARSFSEHEWPDNI
jgi:hypothetical protein